VQLHPQSLQELVAQIASRGVEERPVGLSSQPGEQVGQLVVVAGGVAEHDATNDPGRFPWGDQE
jgi:hypothetical protein